MSRRTVAALAVGAATGLALAGAELFSAPGSVNVGGLNTDVMARVNGRPILRTDYVSQLQTLSGKPWEQTQGDERRRVLQDMVREELFVQRGLETDFAATDAEVRAALVRAVEQQVTADAQFAQPDELTLRRFHGEHPDLFVSAGTMSLRAFERAAPTDAHGREQLIKQASLRIAGADPARSLDADGWRPMPDLGGTPELYVALERRLGTRLFDEVRLLPAGSYSQPLLDDGRIVVFQVVQHRPPLPRSFETARADVLRAWSRAAAAERLKETEAFLRSRADIRYGAGAANAGALP